MTKREGRGRIGANHRVRGDRSPQVSTADPRGVWRVPRDSRAHDHHCPKPPRPLKILPAEVEKRTRRLLERSASLGDAAESAMPYVLKRARVPRSARHGRSSRRPKGAPTPALPSPTYGESSRHVAIMTTKRPRARWPHDSPAYGGVGGSTAVVSFVVSVVVSGTDKRRRRG